MLHQIKEFIYSICQPIIDFCIALGDLGLFALAFAESSFFLIPPDFIYIPMVLSGHEHPYQLAFICTAGSVLGGLFGYAIGYYGGRPIADRFLNHKYLDKAHELFEEYGSLAVLIAAFTPIPYKVFTIGAGISAMRKREFIFWSVIGRGGRFFAVTFLLVHFGETIMENFFKASLVLGVLALAAFVIYKISKHRIKAN